MTRLAHQTPSVTPVRWMAWLFVIGSACFVVGVPLSLWDTSNPAAPAATFFIGSIFFTSAASIQMLLAYETFPDASARTGLSKRLTRLLDHRNATWTSAVIQWLGTLYFNVTTLRSVLDAVDAGSVSTNLVWFPDAIGSALFLVSSTIAFTPEVRAHRHGHVRDRSWTIVTLNMVGSVFFGLSAVGAYTLPDSGELVDIAWSNGGTALGALCFLVAAWLVIPSPTPQQRSSSENLREV